ncbi:MAG: TIR domain-containing protein [Acetatifactor sp.]|nr:TIR domain-containing protein [Acetatifactor sp.]
MGEKNQEEITQAAVPAEVIEKTKEEKPVAHHEHGKHAPREYVAFISYRHTELDKKVAKKIHYMVEHYIIPKELRKDGNKKLGKVFRDEEELPVSSNLTQSIETALDHSKFLIVICTPNLPKSIWCQREIAYFMEKHGRDHVVGILVDGTPDEAFPQLLTQHVELDEEGNENVREVEPLAANLTDVNHRYKESRLRKEAVRLYAALLGCPFDSLWQREKRQKMRKLVALMALVMTIALAFCASIYRKNLEIIARNEQIEGQNVQIQSQNEEIKEQYDEIQDKNADLKRSEAQALVTGGELLFENGNVRDAIQNARLAVASKEGREVVGAEAEFLLYRALGSGRRENYIRTVGVIEQEEDVECMVLSDDGSRLYTLGNRGFVRCFSTETDELIWFGDSLDRDFYYDMTIMHRLKVLTDQGLLLICRESRITALSLEDGSLVWTFLKSDSGSPDFACLSEDQKKLALLMRKGDYFNPNNIFCILDTATGEVTKQIELPEELQDRDLIGYGDMVGTFSADGQYFVGMIYKGRYSVNKFTGHLFLVNLETDEFRIISEYDYADETDNPFTIGMLCHEEDQSVVLVHYRPDLNSISSEKIYFTGKREEPSVVAISLPDRGKIEIPYATTFVPGTEENNAFLASCQNMTLICRMDNGLIVASDQSSAENILERSWICPAEYSRSDLSGDGHHYSWFGFSGYCITPFSEKRHIAILDITKDYATSKGGYGYNMDDNLVEVLVSDDNYRRIYVQKCAKDPDVVTPEWASGLDATLNSNMIMKKLDDHTLVVAKHMDEFARIYFVDVNEDKIVNQADAYYDSLASYSSFYQLEKAYFFPDQKHFVFEFAGRLYEYDMDAKAGSIVFENEGSILIQADAVSLSDGRVLQAAVAYPKDTEFGQGGGRLLWRIDGDETKDLLCEEGEIWGGILGVYGRDLLACGANGFLIVSSCKGEEEYRSEFVAVNSANGARYTLADMRPEGQEEGKVIVGKKKPVFAVYDEDGMLRVYDILTQSLKHEIELPLGQVIKDVTFGMEDDVIAVYTLDGRLFVYDVTTGNEVFSCEMGEPDSDYIEPHLTCFDDPERGRLLFTASGNDGVGVETKTWKQVMILYDEVDVYFPERNESYKLNRDDTLAADSTEVILKHVPLTLDELIKKPY